MAVDDERPRRADHRLLGPSLLQFLRLGFSPLASSLGWSIIGRMPKNPPQFRTATAVEVPRSPEILFNSLSRHNTHGYLRGEQQDVLRSYEKLPEEQNIALELPTGTGKTAVGLLIAEWRRRKYRQRTAFLSLTNQLGQQVLQEARKLGIRTANLLGSRTERDQKEVGYYLNGEAIAISTYSNLFNVNPVIQDPATILLDDAHGGETYVSSMWTVEIQRADDEDLYQELFTAFRPSLTSSQIKSIESNSPARPVELCNPLIAKNQFAVIEELLDAISDPGVKFPWSLVRECLDRCLILISRSSVTIRPLASPASTHSDFAKASQRLFLSATLGGAGDIQRSYGITKLVTIRAENPQLGRRYIFVPGLYHDAGLSVQAVGRMVEQATGGRCMIVSPSHAIGDHYYDTIASCVPSGGVDRITAKDISESLDSFIESERTILTISRYDGIDLPDDHCRLLVVAESPKAVNSLERHLDTCWKLGPVLVRRERTRLVQGMGRCTRSSTDYAVVVWLGQSLVNSATSRLLTTGMPSKLRQELSWGLAQSNMSLDDIVSMVETLIADDEYRVQANASIDGYEIEVTPENAVEGKLEGTVGFEVRAADAMWAGDWHELYELARKISDSLSGEALSGYRAWWYFLAAWAAIKIKEEESALDSLNRAIATGINRAWLREFRQGLVSEVEGESEGDEIENLEALWENLDRLGWAGPQFAAVRSQTISQLKETKAASVHHGLAELGRFLGFRAEVPKGQGDPDCHWLCDGRVVIAFEAKTEKQAGSTLSKKEVLQSQGHHDWLRHTHGDGLDTVVVVVAPSSELDPAAVPHASGLFFVDSSTLHEWVEDVLESVGKLRTKFAGSSFASSRGEFASHVQTSGCDVVAVLKRLTGMRLQP